MIAEPELQKGPSRVLAVPPVALLQVTNSNAPGSGFVLRKLPRMSSVIPPTGEVPILTPRAIKLVGISQAQAQSTADIQEF